MQLISSLQLTSGLPGVNLIHQHLYVQLFLMNIVLPALSSYALALAKNSYKKCARKMLMKSTAGPVVTVFVE
jgi:hypothetical protein